MESYVDIIAETIVLVKKHQEEMQLLLDRQKEFLSKAEAE